MAAKIFHHFGVHLLDLRQIAFRHGRKVFPWNADAKLRNQSLKVGDALLRAFQFDVIVNYGVSSDARLRIQRNR